MPLHIPNFHSEEVVRTLEILIEKNLGSERLFEQYLLLNIEKNVLKFSPEQYARTVRALADKGYYEDPVFWQNYMFKYVNHDKRGVEGARNFGSTEAKMIWDSLAFLKFKVPQIDLKDTLTHVEKHLEEKPTVDPRIFNDDYVQYMKQRAEIKKRQAWKEKNEGVLDPEVRDNLRTRSLFKKTVMRLGSTL